MDKRIQLLVLAISLAVIGPAQADDVILHRVARRNAVGMNVVALRCLHGGVFQQIHDHPHVLGIAGGNGGPEAVPKRMWVQRSAEARGRAHQRPDRAQD